MFASLTRRHAASAFYGPAVVADRGSDVCSGELCWALLFSGLIQQWPSRLDLVLRVGGSVCFSLSSCFCKYWMAVKYKKRAVVSV